MVLEICVDSLESAKAAQGGNAQRVELCSALSEGGITPSSGLIQTVRESLTIPVFVMIRPRAGDFVYTNEEFELMRRDIQAASLGGADGVVLGVLLKNGEVDVERTLELVQQARSMEVTFHRAIDWAPDMEAALEQVIACGAHRVLTSGGMPTAVQGIDSLTRIVAKAKDRIRVMVCGGIRRTNVAEVARRTGASEFHASLRKRDPSPAVYRKPGLHLGAANGDEFARYRVSPEDVRAMRRAMGDPLNAVLENGYNRAT